jgi:hypothetical protein
VWHHWRVRRTAHRRGGKLEWVLIRLLSHRAGVGRCWHEASILKGIALSRQRLPLGNFVGCGDRLGRRRPEGVVRLRRRRPTMLCPASASTLAVGLGRSKTFGRKHRGRSGFEGMGCCVCAVDGSRDGLHVLLAGLVVKVLDAPLWERQTSDMGQVHVAMSSDGAYLEPPPSRAPWQTSWLEAQLWGRPNDRDAKVCSINQEGQLDARVSPAAQGRSFLPSGVPCVFRTSFFPTAVIAVIGMCF